MIDRSIFDIMFEKIPMGVFISDDGGYFKYVNPMACEMTGYSINELIGMKWDVLVPEEYKSDAKSVINVLKRGKGSDIKTGYKTKSGEIRKWGIKSIKISDEIFVVVTEDITEYESVVNEKEKYLSRLRLAGEIGKVGSWEYDIKKGSLWRSEEAARQFTGISKEDYCVIEDMESNLVQKGKLKSDFDTILKTKRDGNTELEIIDDNGKRKILKAYAKTVKENGEIQKIIGATVDITEIKKAEAQITEEKNRLRDYLNIAEVILLVLDNNGFIKMINRKGCDVLGYSEKEILGKSWVDNFIPQYMREEIKELHLNSLFEKEVKKTKVENPVITADGSLRLIHWDNTVIKDSDGIVIGSLSSGEDVTERRKIEKALEKSEATLKKAEILTKSGHFEKDILNNRIVWSEGMYILLGYKPMEMVIDEEVEKEILTKESIDKLNMAYHNAGRGKKEFEEEIQALSKDKTKLTLQIIGVVECIDNSPAKVLATCQNITGSKEHLEHIRFISYHDQLTGLYNRRFLEEEFNRLDVQRNYPFVIIMADVNGLKLANDTFGHSEGDQMLINTAQLLKSSVRQDDIIARVGGDEFMILLPKIDKSAVDKIIARILDDSKKFQTTVLPLSVAVGSATKNSKGITRDELFKTAEDNMYRSKLHEAASRRNKAIKIISDTLYEKNKREEVHSERVSILSALLGTAAGLSRNEINELKTLGLMHDIGKIAVKNKYLNKASALTAEEFEDIKKHPEAGYRILSTSNDMADLAESVLCHHERWDGKGYPRGLKGEDIPFLARIISITEAYDAMTNKSPYKKPLTHRKAYLEIRKNAGSQFDPGLSKIFLQSVWPDLR